MAGPDLNEDQQQQQQLVKGVKESVQRDGFESDDGGGEGLVMTENKGKNRKRARENEKETELLQDPLVVFGSDIMLMILKNLDARRVALSLLVSRGWHGVASSDKLWSSKTNASSMELHLPESANDSVNEDALPKHKGKERVIKCEELWLGKAHIPHSSQMRGISKLAAYSFSVTDGKRTRIMKEDLCDHVWEFHFEEEAPEYWKSLDPYWKGTGPLMRRYFHPDGTQSADPGDKVWGGHECSYLIVTSFVDGGRIRKHYVRINRWPRMFVTRKQDWSWVMANHLYCYSSIPDAEKEGGTGPLFPVWTPAPSPSPSEKDGL
ncbi:hypothetical protein HHK36_012976 [Tetracentron sinense]|uniref:F-box domain-containing protein n=1 Tax=Tetracentron sinense TaxID=13715 RepID=A0A834ZAA8_TETSI|nr:hypothetical protein HHK36_012976 [Tetracentron sinense]